MIIKDKRRYEGARQNELLSYSRIYLTCRKHILFLRNKIILD